MGITVIRCDKCGKLKTIIIPEETNYIRTDGNSPIEWCDCLKEDR